jgi:hypothetical protein
MENGTKEAQKCCNYFWDKDCNKELYDKYILFKDAILENTANKNKQVYNIIEK